MIEQYQPEGMRLFDDPIIRHVLPGFVVLLTKPKFIRNGMIKLFDKWTQGVYGWLVCRTRYMDDQTQTLVNKGVHQILILGAGLDTRAYRIKGIEKTSLFEVDLASVQEYKKKKIKRALGGIPAHVKYAPIDFNLQTIGETLQKNQFDFSKPVFIIWEGVTQYITKEAVEKVFEFFSELATGSYIVFSYVLESVINKKSEIPGANKLVKLTEKTNAPWLFGIESIDIIPWLEKYKLSLIEDIGAVYCKEKYLQPIHRHLDLTEIERVVFAKANDKE
jgi:methyltransferase (TIGR00027 family)